MSFLAIYYLAKINIQDNVFYEEREGGHRIRHRVIFAAIANAVDKYGIMIETMWETFGRSVGETSGQKR